MNYYDRNDPERILSSVFALYRSNITQLHNSLLALSDNHSASAASMRRNFYRLLKATVALETALLPAPQRPSMQREDLIQLCRECFDRAAMYLQDSPSVRNRLPVLLFESSAESHCILCSKHCIERILLNMICGSVSVLSYKNILSFLLEPLWESTLISICDKTRLKGAENVALFPYWSDLTPIRPIDDADAPHQNVLRVAQSDSGGMTSDPVLWFAHPPRSYDEYDPTFDVDDEPDFATQDFAEAIRAFQAAADTSSSDEEIAAVHFDIDPEFDPPRFDTIEDTAFTASEYPTAHSDITRDPDVFFYNTYENPDIAFSICAALSHQCGGQFSIVCSETYGSFITLTLPNQPFGFGEELDILPAALRSSNENFNLFLTELSDILPGDVYSCDTI